MPNKLVKSYAEQTGKSVEAVEKIWDETKKEAKSQFKNETPRFYAYVNSVVRKKLKLEESKTTFKDYLNYLKEDL
jgi:hypothetical protein